MHCLLYLNQLSSPNDIFCDDMGVWKWSGSSKRWVLVDYAGFVAFIKERDIERNSCYILCVEVLLLS